LCSGGLAGHQQAKLTHSLGSFARLRFWTLPLLVFTIAMLLIEFLLAALTLLLEALDDVDSTASGTVIVVETIACGSIEAGGLILAAKGIGGAG
jgi:hypothetical protein